MQIFLLISEAIQRIEETDLLSFEGIYLTAEAGMNEVIKSNFSCTDRATE